MASKLKILGTVRKAHVFELQIHQQMDQRTFLLEYETHSAKYSPDRLELYANQGQYLISSKGRSAVAFAAEDEDVA